MNKFKNTITNILGVILWFFSYDAYKNDKSLYFILTLLIVGLSLFLFKMSETKVFIKDILSKFTK
jgi:hypothetical protein